MRATLFQHVNLFDGVTPEIQSNRFVLVESGRIKEVSDHPIQCVGAQHINAPDTTLMPGLIDAHYHAVASDVSMRVVERQSPYHIAQFARQYLEASLQRGFTTIRDAGGADWGLAQAVEDGLIQGPRLIYGGRGLSQTGGHGDFRDRGEALCACGQMGGVLCQVADGVDAVRKAAREELRKGASHIKIMASGGVASPADPIDNLQYSEEEIRAAVWEAKSWGRYVMAHAYTSAAIERCVKFGVRSIEHGNLIDAHTAALCQEKGAFVVPTLMAYEGLARDGESLGLSPVSLAKLSRVRDAGLQALEILKNAGVKVGFGSDLLGGLQDYQSEEFLIRSEVYTPMELLMQATSGNAELLQMSGEIGEIRPGASADLLLVDGDPSADLNCLQEEGRFLLTIMKQGKLIKHLEK